MRRRLSTSAGLSLVEVAIVLSVMAMVAGVIAPAGMGLVAQARDVRVAHDCDAIRQAVLTMVTDLGRTDLRLGVAGARVELLVTGGEVPQAADPATGAWTRGVDASGAVDLLDRHLVFNEPAGNPGYSWLTPSRSGGPGWRGAYLKADIGADPWGRRYAVNVKYLGRKRDVLVLSAGADGLVETPFEARNVKYGGDDIAALVQ